MPRTPMTGTKISSLTNELVLTVMKNVYSLQAINEALAQTNTQSKRIRALPASMAFYLVLLTCLNPEVSVKENLRLLLDYLQKEADEKPRHVVVGSAISKARSKLGVSPFRFLFEKWCRPLGDETLPSVFWKGFRVAACDGTTLEVQDSPANRQQFGKHGNQYGQSGYPQLKLACLIECGTRAPFAFAYGSAHTDEGKLFDQICEHLDRQMLFLTDRAYYSFRRWKKCAETAGALLWRLKSNLQIRMLEPLPDGSWLGEIRSWPQKKCSQKKFRPEKIVLRVIEFQAQFADGTKSEVIRLGSTLLDYVKYPALEAAGVFLERWQEETGYDEFKTHLKGAYRILRSPVPALVEQELYAFMLMYYLVRRIIAEAARKGGVSPGEISFVHSVRVIKRRLAFSPSADF